MRRGAEAREAPEPALHEVEEAAELVGDGGQRSAHRRAAEELTLATGAVEPEAAVESAGARAEPSSSSP